MRLRIGPTYYRVRLWPGPIMHDGEVSIGLCAHREQMILVSSEVPEPQRASVLADQAVHAAAYYAPPPAGQHELAGWLAVVAGGLVEDLREAQNVEPDRFWIPPVAADEVPAGVHAGGVEDAA